MGADVFRVKFADLDLEPGKRNGDGTTCWACGVSESIHEHHIIPRSAGGINGPTVDLCAVCHNAVHKPQEEDSAFMDEDEHAIITLAKREWLRNIIIDSIVSTKSDVNRPMTFSDRFPPLTSRQLRDLAAGLEKPQNQIVRMAIAHLHNTYFRKPEREKKHGFTEAQKSY